MFRSMMIASAVLASVLVAPAAFAQTIGYVDTARVLVSYKGAQSASAQVQKELAALQKEFAERQKKIADAQKSGKSQAELQKLIEQYEKELIPLKERAAKLDQRLSADVRTKIISQIQAIAKKRKVDLVLDKGAVYYGGVDLTDDVIKSLK